MYVCIHILVSFHRPFTFMSFSFSDFWLCMLFYNSTDITLSSSNVSFWYGSLLIYILITQPYETSDWLVLNIGDWAAITSWEMHVSNVSRVQICSMHYSFCSILNMKTSVYMKYMLTAIDHMWAMHGGESRKDKWHVQLVKKGDNT